MSRRRAFALVIAVTLLVGLAAAPAASAGSGFVFYNNRASTNGTNYNRQNDYKGPKNLAAHAKKPATMTITVHRKASAHPVRMQICAWQRGPGGKWTGKGTNETCAKLTDAITKTGTYTFRLPPAASWWSKNGRYNWSQGADAVGVMVKDGQNPKKLMMYKRCGKACHPKGANFVRQHTPIDFTANVRFG